MKDINLTAFMEREGIVRIERKLPSGFFVVELVNGMAGSGGTVAAALKSAHGQYAVRLTA
jgi:DNA helicase IV